MSSKLYSKTEGTRREWWWLGGEHQLPVSRGQWVCYDPGVCRVLSLQYDAMRTEGRDTGLVLDLDSWGLPYQVWRRQAVRVLNRHAQALLGLPERRMSYVVAGHSEEFWGLPPQQLPASGLLRHGAVVAGVSQFAQVHRDDAKLLQEMDQWLADPTSPSWPYPDNPFPKFPRRRVVILIEDDLPQFQEDAYRFRKAPTEDTVRSAWWWLNGEQQLPLRPGQWVAFAQPAQALLTTSYQAMLSRGQEEGLVVDLSPLPYQVWRARPREVLNEHMPELLGRRAVAGYREELWAPPAEQLPRRPPGGRLVPGLFQLHTSHADLMEEFTLFLQNADSPSWPHPEFPRRRVVLLVQAPEPHELGGEAAEVVATASSPQSLLRPDSDALCKSEPSSCEEERPSPPPSRVATATPAEAWQEPAPEPEASLDRPRSERCTVS